VYPIRHHLVASRVDDPLFTDNIIALDMSTFIGGLGQPCQDEFAEILEIDTIFSGPKSLVVLFL